MRCLPVLAALLCCSAASTEVTAQVQRASGPVKQQVSTGASATIVGVVTDEDGEAIAGASVFAMGVGLTAVRTDDRGHFQMTVDPGPYILRATRDGYVSTFREAVQVRSDAEVSRHITLLRADTGDAVLAVAERQIPVEGGAAPATVTSPPGETVWRLRHLPRTVLRERAVYLEGEDRTDVTRRSAVAALADLTGHVDFLTTSALTASGDLAMSTWPRGVAYVVVGAPVGNHGDWLVRAALAGGDNSAWTLTGDYTSNREQAHVLRAGMTYSAQTLPQPGDRLQLATVDTVRRVGSMYLSDAWAVTDDLQLDSRVQLARYDYLAEPALFNSRIDARQRVWPRFTVLASAASERMAPGADQFAPPASAGVWLPPERTFSALRGGLRAQQVVSYEIGADAVLVPQAIDDADFVLRVRRFSEHATNQLATVFGIDAASEVGHYYVDSAGNVAVDGWMFGIAGRLAPNVSATLDYTGTFASWDPAAPSPFLSRVAGSTVRIGRERLHDVMTTLHADVPTTATKVMIALRVNSGFSRHGMETPGVAARFAVEVRQQLPIRLLAPGELNLLFSARTLLHEADAMGGFYDELLTVAPPVRLMCGVQMRF